MLSGLGLQSLPVAVVSALLLAWPSSFCVSWWDAAFLSWLPMREHTSASCGSVLQLLW